MKPNFIQQEILLVPKAHLLNTEWQLRDEKENKKLNNAREHFIEMCWNGTLSWIIPEIIEKDKEGKPLPIWEVNEMKELVELRMGECGEMPADDWSLNPTIYLMHACEN